MIYPVILYMASVQLSEERREETNRWNFQSRFAAIGPPNSVVRGA